MTENQLKELLNDMSLSEKVEQLVQFNGALYGKLLNYTGPKVDFQLQPDQQYRVGSVLGECGAKKLHELQDKIMEKQPHHIPAVFMTDIIHGLRTVFPVPIAIGSSFDPELAEEISSAAAREAAASGIHLTFAPMADLARDSRWGRCMESTGEDPYLNARMAESMVKGFQGDDYSKKGKVAACVKHFAAYGAVQSGRDYNVAELSENSLRDDYLTAYKAAIHAGVSMVMTAFNTIDRVPCTINKKLMRNILRDEMGFDGVLISDYAAIEESITHGVSADRRDAAERAIKAGCDIDMMTECYLKNLEKLVNDGSVDIKLVDEAVMRILNLKNKLGLFKNPYKDGSEQAEKEILFCKEHRELSRRAAEETTVLLKNNGVLPLDRSKKIAVIGALADSCDITGTWAIFVDKSETVTLKQAISELYPDADIEFVLSDDAEKAAEAAKKCDIAVLALGEDESRTGESRSVTDIRLSEKQRRLFDSVCAVNENTVVMLFGGRPLAVPEIAKKAAAILEVWLPGSMGCYAAADILFGKVSPSGRLSMSMPYCTGQLPISYSAFSTGRPKPEGAEGYIPFLSNYMDCPNVPLYPFGYGLSYTNFEYSEVELDNSILTSDGKITASVTVKNTGKTDGYEVVQLYIRDIKGSVVRPMRQLKGFKRVFIGAGKSETVSFDITEEMLRFCNDEMKYVSESGDFRLWIGGSSLTQNGVDFILE